MAPTKKKEVKMAQKKKKSSEIRTADPEQP